MRRAAALIQRKAATRLCLARSTILQRSFGSTSDPKKDTPENQSIVKKWWNSFFGKSQTEKVAESPAPADSTSSHSEPTTSTTATTTSSAPASSTHETPQESDQPSSSQTADADPSATTAGANRTTAENRTRSIQSSLISMEYQVLPVPPERDLPVPQLARSIRPILLKDTVVTVSEVDPHFEKVHQPDEIDFSKIPPFVSSSRDRGLVKLARANDCKIVGSSSSTTPFLSHIHFLLLDFRPQNFTSFGDYLTGQLPPYFTKSACKPALLVLRNRGGVWGMDSHPEPGEKPNQILIDLGKIMERSMTMEKKDFIHTLVKNKGFGAAIEQDEDAGVVVADTADVDPSKLPDAAAAAAAATAPPAAAATAASAEFEPAMFFKVGQMLFRAQLDARDPLLRGKRKVFDLKTRATLPIRLDVANHEKYTEYEIVQEKGALHSYEREIFDMARSAFLKYSLQCRIGQMGGIFVAFHNTQKIFGYKYISLEHMDSIIFGSTSWGNKCFDISVKLMQLALRTVVDKFPNDQSIKTLVYARRPRKRSEPLRDRVIIMFVERLPPPQHDPHKNLPFEQRYSSLLRIDSLSSEELNGHLTRLGVDATGTRVQRVARLEEACAWKRTEPLPPVEYFAALASKGYLHAYKMRLQLYVNDELVVQPGPIQYQKGNSVKASYKLKPIRLGSDALGRMYLRAMNDHRGRASGSARLNIPMKPEGPVKSPSPAPDAPIDFEDLQPRSTDTYVR